MKILQQQLLEVKSKIRSSFGVSRKQLEDFIQALRYRAQEHRYTVMVGRSHGIHAEPITFGFKLAGWLAEVLRGRDRRRRAVGLHPTDAASHGGDGARVRARAGPRGAAAAGVTPAGRVPKRHPRRLPGGKTVMIREKRC